MTPFTFFLDWTLNCQFVGLIWARDKGLYAEAGLEVRLVDTDEQPDKTTLDLVLSHDLAAGCMEDNLVVRANLAGKNVRAIGAMLQMSPMVLMTGPDSGIRTLQDLPGRRVAMYEDGIHLLKTVLTLHGIDPSTVDTTSDNWSPEALVSGRFDAVQGYIITEPATLAKQGFETHLIPVQHHEIHPYAQMMFATTTCINTHEDILCRFMKASFEGWRQAMTHRDEAAELVVAVSTEQPDAMTNRDILEAMVPIVAGQVGLERSGALERDRWERNLATYARFGLVDRLATFDEVIDTRFLP